MMHIIRLVVVNHLQNRRVVIGGLHLDKGNVSPLIFCSQYLEYCGLVQITLVAINPTWPILDVTHN